MSWLIFTSLANAADTDGDGLDDGREDVNGDGTFQNDDTDGDSVPNYLDVDDDNDLLSTLDELSFGTDWLTFDTDGGGVGDGAEVLAGTSPIDPSDDGQGGMSLDVSPGAAGTLNQWIVRGAPPHSIVTVFGSANAGGAAVPACPNAPTGLGAPVRVGWDQASASGTARVNVFVPQNLSGVTAHFQAMILPGCTFTPVIVDTF